MSRVIDADGHVVENADEFARFGWDGRSTGYPALDMMLARGRELIQFGLCTDASPWDPEARLADMDREGIAVSVNYPTALLVLNQVEPAIATDLCRVYNDWAHATFTEPTESRVRTMALVAIADPASAAREARRAVTELGAPGVAVSPFAGEVHLDDPALDALWDVCEELDVPVGIHGGRNTTEPLLPIEGFRDQKRYYAMAHPFGQMIAMGDLAVGGVFDRHPRLRVAFLESGVGWVRWYADRLDAGWADVRHPGADPTAVSERAPTEYVFGGRCFFSCEPDEPNLAQVIDGVGREHVVFASDYPHFDCKFPHSVDAITEAGLDAAVLTAVTVDNPPRLYGLPIA